MRNALHFLQTASLMAAAFTAPMLMTPTPMQAQQRYHDEARNDDHEWNNHEDRAYRIWVKQNHRKYQNFAQLRAEDQRNYWAWRHEHSDVQLKINIP